MKRLRYIKTSDYTLDIDLENNYWVNVMAKYNYDTKKYDISFYIKEQSIGNYIPIETLNNEKITFEGARKTIKTDILRYVSGLLSANYFDDCIKSYEYEIQCFDKGNEFFEKERRKKIHDNKK